MTEQAATTERLSEVTRLATLLADRVLDAQIMSRPIADVQIRALLDAALVLGEHAAPLSPLLMQVLHEIDKFSGRGALVEMPLMRCPGTLPTTPRTVAAKRR